MKRETTKIRLAKTNVRFICRVSERKDGLCLTVEELEAENSKILRFGGIGGERGTFEIHEKYVLNLEFIDLKPDKIVKIVVPERISFGLFHCTTFTREIILPI